jgi:hypothetical protein
MRRLIGIKNEELRMKGVCESENPTKLKHLVAEVRSRLFENQ